MARVKCEKIRDVGCSSQCPSAVSESWQLEQYVECQLQRQCQQQQREQLESLQPDCADKASASRYIVSVLTIMHAQGTEIPALEVKQLWCDAEDPRACFAIDAPFGR